MLLLKKNNAHLQKYVFLK